MLLLLCGINHFQKEESIGVIVRGEVPLVNPEKLPGRDCPLSRDSKVRWGSRLPSKLSEGIY